MNGNHTNLHSTGIDMLLAAGDGNAHGAPFLRGPDPNPGAAPRAAVHVVIVNVKVAAIAMSSVGCMLNVGIGGSPATACPTQEIAKLIQSCPTGCHVATASLSEGSWTVGGVPMINGQGQVQMNRSLEPGEWPERENEAFIECMIPHVTMILAWPLSQLLAPLPNGVRDGVLVWCGMARHVCHRKAMAMGVMRVLETALDGGGRTSIEVDVHDDHASVLQEDWHQLNILCKHTTQNGGLRLIVVACIQHPHGGHGNASAIKPGHLEMKMRRVVRHAQGVLLSIRGSREDGDEMVAMGEVSTEAGEEMHAPSPGFAASPSPSPPVAIAAPVVFEAMQAGFDAIHAKGKQDLPVVVDRRNWQANAKGVSTGHRRRQCSMMLRALLLPVEAVHEAMRAAHLAHGVPAPSCAALTTHLDHPHEGHVHRNGCLFPFCDGGNVNCPDRWD